MTKHRRKRLRIETLERRHLLAVVFSDTFPNAAFDTNNWATIEDASISTLGQSEPSTPYAARFNGDPDGGDLLESKVIDLSSVADATLTYNYQRRGGGNSPETGEDLIVEYRNGAGTWVELERQLGSGADMTIFDLSAVTLPTAAHHAGFQFRFLNTGTAGNLDDWFVDDISVDATPSGLAAPVLDAEPATTPGTENTVSWSSVSGATSYYVEYDTDASFASPDGNSGWTTQLSHTFTGLTPSTTYFYRVKARDGTGVATWQSTGNMVNGASWFSGDENAALVDLDDGRALALSSLSAPQIFDPVTDSWSATAATPYRISGSAIKLADGRVLWAGGYNGGTLDTAELYDPISNTWSNTGSMHQARSESPMVLLDDGRALIVGGYNNGELASAEIFDPTTGVWTVTDALPVGRQYAPLVKLQNGQVLISGGYSTANTSTLDSSYLYNPVTETWSATGDLPASRDRHSAVLLDNGDVLVTGSGFGSTTVYRYDMVTGIWSTAASMSQARRGVRGLSLADGSVLVAGGEVLAGGSSYLNSTEVYDAINDTWSSGPSMANSRANYAIVELQNGDVLIAGGYAPEGGDPNEAEILPASGGNESDWSAIEQSQQADATNPSREDFETGDLTAFPWQLSGDADWIVTSASPISGSYHARAGTISNNQSSSLSVTMTTIAGNIEFDRKVSSEPTYDFLRFYVDDVLKDQWSGEVATAPQSYAVSAGSHTFRWTYDKDISQSHNSDTAWIDNIVFPVGGSGAPTGIDLIAASDTGLSSTDDLTNLDNSSAAKQLQFSVSGTITGATVTIYDGATAIGSAVASGAFTTVTTNGTLDLSDGSHSIVAKQTEPSESESAASPSLSITIDTAAPSAPVLPPILQSSSDTGVHDFDGITRDSTPTFDISAAPFFRVYQNGSLISGDYETGTTYTTAFQLDSSYTYRMTSVDAAGNESALSPTSAVTIDSVPPSSGPIVDLLASSDSGVSSTDNLTNDDTPTFELRWPSYYRFFVDGTQISDDYEDASTYTLSSQTDGAYAITARELDVAGNMSPASSTLSLTIDSAGPTADIVDVTPDPRVTAVDSIVVQFSEPVSGFGLSDLSLELETVNVSLTAANDPTTIDNQTFNVPALTSLTDGGGTYELTLSGAGSGITDLAGNALVGDATDTWFRLGTPVMDAEPLTTAGTSNTVSWSTVIGADEYYVEYDTSSDFSSPDGNSGWGASTSHTFSGLTAGETYYYRARARQTTPGSTDVWNQTTQAEFVTGALVNTVATLDGDVTLSGGAAGSSSIFVYAGSAIKQSFLDDLTNAGHSITVSSVFPATPADYDVILLTGQSSLNTVPSAQIDAFTSAGGGLIVMAGAYLHDILPTTANSSPVSSYSSWVLRSGTTVQTSSSPLVSGLSNTSDLEGYSMDLLLKAGAETAIQWNTGAVPMAVTYANGEGKIAVLSDLWAWYFGSTSWTGDQVYGQTLMENAIDYVSPAIGYTTSGTITSSNVTPSPFTHWTTLEFGATTPANSSFTVDVLDSSDVVLASDVTSGTDLQTLGITASNIKLRANLATTDPTATPTLSDWTVNYQETADTTLDGAFSASEFSQQEQPAAAPEVATVVINDGSDSRSQITSVTVTFDTEVDHTQLESAFTITNLETLASVETILVAATNVNGQTIATLTFDGLSTINRMGSGSQGNSLADGNYRLAISAAFVRSTANNLTMTDDYGFGGQTREDENNDDFFRLLGDANGDGFRNGSDLNELVLVLFKPANYRSDLDTNGDGFINGSDLNELIPTLFGPPRI